MSTPDSGRWLHPSAFLNYGAAVLSVTTALFIALLLQAKFNFEPLVPFLCAMMFSAWFGGVKPGLLALSLSLLAFHYYFLIPIYPLGAEKEIPRLLVAALTSVIIVLLSAAQRSATEALRESELRLRQIAENIQGVFWMATPAMDELLYVSPAYKSMWGRSQESLRQRPQSFFEAIHPEDREQAIAIIKGQREQGFDIEYRIVRPDGTMRWIRDRAFPVKDASGRVYRIAGVAEDITERKLAVEAVAQAEARLRLVLDTTPAMIHTGRPDGYLDYFNQRWLKYVGLSSADMQGWAWTATVHPEDVEEIVNRWRASLACGEPFEDEARLRRADGQYRWMLHRKVPLRDEHGNIVKWYGSSTDIEDRKRAEEALRQSEERFAAFMDNLPGYAWMKDLQGRYVYVNQMVRRLPRYWSLGKTDAEIWPADLAAQYQANDQQVIASKKPLHTVEHFQQEGKQRYMVGSKFPIFDKTGAVALVGGAGVDITERIEAEEALKNSFAQLRALSARLQSVREEEAARIAREIHDELGQKLTGLKMDLRRAELKLEELESSPEVNALVDTLVNATELTDGITASVQEIAASLRPGVLDKLGLGSALHYEGRRFQERTGTSCVVSLPETEPNLPAKVSTALFRIFQECLTNIARHARATKVEAMLKLQDGWVTLRVRDNGCGITEADIANPKSLGLLGMKERTESLGGEIVFQGAATAGTIVNVRIPNAAVPAQTGEPNHASVDR